MWAALPDERRLRLASLESELGMIGRQLQLGLWKLVAERLDEFGARIEGHCDGCRYRRERRRDQVEVDVVDMHIAPYDDVAYTGERMRAAAAAAGLRDHSHIHGVFDMDRWIHPQFEQQFDSYERSACADIMQVADYLIDAGRVVAGVDGAIGWGMMQKRRLLDGQFDAVRADLAATRARRRAPPTSTRSVASRSLGVTWRNHESYVDQPFEPMKTCTSLLESVSRNTLLALEMSERNWPFARAQNSKYCVPLLWRFFTTLVIPSNLPAGALHLR
jgi:hypothetical protein